MQIIEVTHSALPSQLPGLLYEVDIIFCVDANPRFSEIQKWRAWELFGVLLILSSSLNWSRLGVSTLLNLFLKQECILIMVFHPPWWYYATCVQQHAPKFVNSYGNTNRQACMSAVGRRGTKREHNFLIPLVANNVCRVLLLTFRRFVSFLVVILLPFWMIFSSLDFPQIKYPICIYYLNRSEKVGVHTVHCTVWQLNFGEIS